MQHTPFIIVKEAYLVVSLMPRKFKFVLYPYLHSLKFKFVLLITAIYGRIKVFILNISLEVYNTAWRTGDIRLAWRSSLVRIILKHAQLALLIVSYPSSSLISCL